MAEYNSDDEEYVTRGDILKGVGRYEGERNADWQRHGRGKAAYENGDRYEGEFRAGTRHGRGNYKFRNARYEGSYEHGQRNGFGTMIYPDQSQYRGSWKDGKRHGKGEYVFVNGDIFIGQYENDLRHGFGTYHFNGEKESRLSGEWAQGHQVGNGRWKTCTYTYEGEFNNCVPHGKGKFVFENGSEQHGCYNVKKVFHKVDDNSAELVGKKPAWRASALVESTETDTLRQLNVL